MNYLDKFKIQDYINKNSLLHPTWSKELIYFYLPSPCVTFQEIPDEISLTIASLCYNSCSQYCNSKFCWFNNWKEEKAELTIEILKKIIELNEGISCVTIMTSTNFFKLKELFTFCKTNYPNLKTALYVGQELDNLLKYKDFCDFDFSILDYLKVGPFKKEYGPLNNPNTNQRFYKINHTQKGDIFECINEKFLTKI